MSNFYPYQTSMLTDSSLIFVTGLFKWNEKQAELSVLLFRNCKWW